MARKIVPNMVSDDPLLGWRWYFLGLVLLNLLPIWIFPFFPSQDGPAHLDSAVVLRALANGDAFFQGYYDAHWRLATNQIYHLLLVGLGSIFSFLTAEKLILSFYVIMLPLAVLFAIRQLQISNPLAVFLVFPVIYSYILQKGFYNYCLGLIFFLFAIGLYFRLARIPTLKNSIVLSAALLVTYFTHVIVAASALLAIGSMALGRFLRRFLRRRREFPAQSTEGLASNWREVGLLSLSVAPVIIVVIAFLLYTGAFTAREDVSLFTLVTQSPLKLTVLTRPSLVLTTFSIVDLAISLPWTLLLFSLAGIALLKGSQHRDDSQHGFLAFGVIVFLILILTIPRHIGPITYLFSRFLPYFYFLFILWLAAKPLTPFIWRHAAILGIVLSAASVAYRLPIYAGLNHDLAEFTSAAAHIEDDSTVLPIVIGETLPGGLVEMHPRVRFNHTAFAAGYIALRRRIVNLRNFQPYMSFFPIRFRDDASPHPFVSGYSGGGKLQVDFDAYEKTTGRRSIMCSFGAPWTRYTRNTRRKSAPFWKKYLASIL